MASGSTRAVYAAIIANSIVGISKFIGFFFSGSGAMLSEGIHSIADTSNQILLAIGIARANRDADADHPYGYGREKFVFALISAVGIFWFGCGVTLYHGISSLLHPHELGSINLAVGILIFSAVIESVTLYIAFVAVRDGAREAGQSLLDFMRHGSDPMGVAVLLEDGAAVLGIFIALGSLGLSHATGNAVWDAVGTLLIAALLGLVAVFLVVRNRTLLLGQAIAPEVTARALALLQREPVVARVHDIKTTVLGSGHARFKAEVEFNGRELAKKQLASQDLAQIHTQLQDPAAVEPFLLAYGDQLIDALGQEIDQIEARLQREVPSLRHVDIEAD